MAKRAVIGDKEIKTGPKEKTHFQAMTLVAGPWKSLFPGDQNKILISRALNYCTCVGDLNIKGYLITKNRLFLVLKSDRKHIDHMLHVFYDTLVKEIKKYLQWMEDLEGFRHEKRLAKIEESLKYPLFTRYPLLDYDMITAITRKKYPLHHYSDPCHYNPRLERLMNKMQDYKFCSVVDYSGACGPVYLHGRCHICCHKQPGEKSGEDCQKCSHEDCHDSHPENDDKMHSENGD